MRTSLVIGKLSSREREVGRERGSSEEMRERKRALFSREIVGDGKSDSCDGKKFGCRADTT